MVMEPPVCPSLVPSQNHRPRSLAQVPISPLDMGMVWSRASPNPCQQTMIEGNQWGPSLQGSNGEGLVQPCGKEEDGQPSQMAPASRVEKCVLWSRQPRNPKGEWQLCCASSTWDQSGLHLLSTAAWAFLCGKVNPLWGSEGMACLISRSPSQPLDAFRRGMQGARVPGPLPRAHRHFSTCLERQELQDASPGEPSYILGVMCHPTFHPMLSHSVTALQGNQTPREPVSFQAVQTGQEGRYA